MHSGKRAIDTSIIPIRPCRNLSRFLLCITIQSNSMSSVSPESYAFRSCTVRHSEKIHIGRQAGKLGAGASAEALPTIPITYSIPQEHFRVLANHHIGSQIDFGFIVKYNTVLADYDARPALRI